MFTNCAWEPCWSWWPQCIREYIWSICACRRWYLKERCRGARMRWRIHIREGFYSNSGWGRSSREGTHTLIPHMMLYHRCCAEERFLCMQSSLNLLYWKSFIWYIIKFSTSLRWHLHQYRCVHFFLQLRVYCICIWWGVYEEEVGTTCAPIYAPSPLVRPPPPQPGSPPDTPCVCVPPPLTLVKATLQLPQPANSC